MNPTLAHTLLAALIIGGYVVLTALGHDANALLAALVGQGLGAGVQKAATGKP